MIVDTVKREAVVWTAMDRWPRLVDALVVRNQTIEAQGGFHEGLHDLLKSLVGKGRLTPDDEDEIANFVPKHSHKVCLHRVK